MSRPLPTIAQYDSGGDFSENNVLSDGASINADLEALDLAWGDLFSNANAEGLSLIGFENTGGYWQGADPEAALQEAGVAVAGAIDGLEVSYTSASVVTIAAGTCRDEANARNITFAASGTCDITVSGIGGTTTAEAVSTWYQVLVIWGSAGVARILHPGAGDPTASLPATYNSGYRRIGWVRNDAAGDFISFTSVGNGKRRFVAYNNAFGSRRPLNGGASVAWASVDCTAYLPPTCNNAHVRLIATAQSAFLGNDNSTQQEACAAGNRLGVWVTTTSAQLLYYQNGAGGGSTVIEIRGYEDVL